MKSSMIKWSRLGLGLIWIGASLASGISFADSLEDYLQRFDQNPSEVMNQPLLRKDRRGNVIPQGKDSKFPSSVGPKKNVLGGDFVDGKSKASGKIRGRAPYERNDRIENLVDVDPREIIRSIEEMDLRFRESTLDRENSPWTDYYWPLYSGALGLRYEDRNLSLDWQWPRAKQYVTDHPLKEFVDGFLSGRLLARQLEVLSPSEKYDLLIGNDELSSRPSFTDSMWRAGEVYLKNNEVERWMGLCHGWAAAAYVVSRPKNPVTVKSPNSQIPITFYPSDVKGLATLLWAEVDHTSRFIGGRCDTKNPKTDKKSGRVIDESCFNTNPASWHMAVVNQIGVAKRSFILDATFDYEVWNQPVVEYRYRYFNPLTRKGQKTLEKATVAYDGAMEKKDTFRNFRKKGTFTHLVGIEMEVTYVVEVQPSHRPQEDAVRTVTYTYDLELDYSRGAEGVLVGGEWYTNLHPDFLWNVPPREQAITDQEVSFLRNQERSAGDTRWSGETLPSTWADFSKTISGQRVPMTSIVNELVSRSQSP